MPNLGRWIGAAFSSVPKANEARRKDLELQIEQAYKQALMDQMIKDYQLRSERQAAELPGIRANSAVDQGTVESRIKELANKAQSSEYDLVTKRGEAELSKAELPGKLAAVPKAQEAAMAELDAKLRNFKMMDTYIKSLRPEQVTEELRAQFMKASDDYRLAKQRADAETLRSKAEMANVDINRTGKEATLQHYKTMEEIAKGKPAPIDTAKQKEIEYTRKQIDTINREQENSELKIKMELQKFSQDYIKQHGRAVPPDLMAATEKTARETEQTISAMRYKRLREHQAKLNKLVNLSPEDVLLMGGADPNSEMNDSGYYPAPGAMKMPASEPTPQSPLPPQGAPQNTSPVSSLIQSMVLDLFRGPINTYDYIKKLNMRRAPTPEYRGFGGE